MPDFLQINGLKVPVALESFQEEIEEVGTTDRAFSGALRRSRIGKKRIASFESVWLAPSEARAWESLIAGEGETWDFESSVYGSKGRGFTLGSLSALESTATKFGNGRLRVFGASTVSVGSSSAWTLLVWRIPINGFVGWDHYAIFSSGSWYRNGSAISPPAQIWASIASGVLTLRSEASLLGATQWAANTAYSVGAYVHALTGHVYYHECTTAGTSGSSAPTWNTTVGGTTNDGTVVWTNRGLASLYIDELVYLPFAVPTTWLTALSSPSASAFSALPQLRISGDAVPETASRIVLGAVESMTLLPGVLNGTRYKNLHKLSVTLSEV